jgi:GDP-D-mannose dehydratase
MPPLLAAIQRKGFVIATGVQCSVRDFVNSAAKNSACSRLVG